MNEIYGLLEQHWFFEMKKGKVLSVLPDGTSWAWLIKEDNCFIWDGDCIFGYDLLVNFPFIKEEMIGCFLNIYLEGSSFVIKLENRLRDEGNKDNEVKYVASGASVLDALFILNDDLRSNMLLKKVCEEKKIWI